MNLYLSRKKPKNLKREIFQSARRLFSTLSLYTQRILMSRKIKIRLYQIPETARKWHNSLELFNDLRLFFSPLLKFIDGHQQR